MKPLNSLVYIWGMKAVWNVILERTVVYKGRKGV